MESNFFSETGLILVRKSFYLITHTLPLAPSFLLFFSFMISHSLLFKVKYSTVVSIYNAVYNFLGAELEKNTEDFLEKYEKFSVYSYFHEIIPVWLRQDSTWLPPKEKISVIIKKLE